MKTRKKGKIIRDVIHGDIYLEPEYVDLIDTKEFQRLRRIKQLSVANMVFPGADHTRFAHSIGTFHVMKLIIEHFEEIFNELSLEMFTEEDKKTALIAALLHDIGHGPFSHAFEKVLRTQGSMGMNHEEMGTRIIQDSSTQIYQVLIDNFGAEYPERVSNMMLKKKEIKENSFNNHTDKPDLTFVLSSLLSSQLDADRMDYLLRDALYTGAKYGTIDLSRTIASMTLDYDRSSHQYCVCIKERYLSDVENCLISRYQMRKEVYFHKLKCEMELVIDKLLFRARELYMEGGLEGKEYLPEALSKMFSNSSLTTAEYLSLDDSILYTLFVIWSKSSDFDLSSLCRTILYREKYHRVSIEDKDCIRKYKSDIICIFKKHGHNVKLKNEAFFLEAEDKMGMYKTKAENIFVLNRYGIKEDIVNVSHLLNFKQSDEEKVTLFINYKLIEQKFAAAALVGELKAIEKKYESRNQIEKEAKYIIAERKQWDDIRMVISTMNGYIISDGRIRTQKDTYYDTKEMMLQQRDITLRIREREGNYICTIKKPVLESQEDESAHSARYEYEENVQNNTLKECSLFIEEHLSGMNAIKLEELQKTLIVENRREIFDITEKRNDNIKFELVFDDVKFRNVLTDKEADDLQMEIELKSDFLHEVNLRNLTDKLEKRIPSLKANTISKYRRGLELTS